MRGKLFRRARSEKGQASLMIGMMLMTFILFFAFVVNTGMLVNAKINLQNAADLAAYAGAATQARQLTEISYLNYEMRRQYKKFLFRYYVVGNMAQRGFGSGGQGPAQWGPTGQGEYGVPAICVLFNGPANSNDNYCQLDQLPPITIPPSNPLDQINETLRQQLLAIEQIRQNNCGAIANANYTIAILWLLNTDPDLTVLQQSVPPSDTDTLAILNVTRSVAYGLGLVPREILLRQRIETLAGYVNAPASVGTTRDTVTAFQQGLDPAANERTIQAYLSAFYTLGEHTYDPSSIVMDELLPSGGTDASNLIALNDIKQSFDTWSVGFTMDGSLNPVNHSVPCKPELTHLTLHDVPLGVSKDPQVLTYYAIRLRARAKVMFSPFGDMDLKAYAAARPFGSRIGPSATDVGQLGYNASPNSQFVVQQVGDNATGIIPNLPVLQNDTSQIGKGWDNNLVLSTMFSQFGGTPAQSIDETKFMNAFQGAMAPNPGEGYAYNIMSDLGTDTFIRNFDSKHQAAFWAPIVSPAKSQNVKDILTQSITDIFQGPDALQAQTKSNAGQADLIKALVNGLTSYIDKIRQGKGEQIVPGVGEGFNIARLQDPFVDDQGNPLQLPPTVMIHDPKDVKTSWVSDLDKTIYDNGRVGYSVKFVSFDSLLHQRTLTNGRDKPMNTTDIGDGEARDDLGQIKH